MLAHARLLLQTIFKERLLILLLLVMIILSFTPLPYQQYPVYGIQYYTDMQYFLADSEARNAYDNAPEVIRNQVDQEKTALADISLANLKGDRKAELTGILAYEQLMLEEIQGGWIIGMLVEHQEVRVTFVNRLLDAGIYDIYYSPHEMPASYYLAASTWYLPAFLCLLPAVLVFSLIAVPPNGSRQLLFELSLPISRFKKTLIDITVGLLVVFAIHLIVALPVVAYMTWQNGFGYLSYPVIDYRNGLLCETTVGGYLLSYYLFIGLASLFIGSLSKLLACFSNSRIILIVTLIVLVFLPSTEQYQQMVTVSDSASLIPLTYLCYFPVIGTVSHFPTDTLMNGVSLFSAAIMLGTWTGAVMLIVGLSRYFEPLISRLKGNAYLSGS